MSKLNFNIAKFDAAYGNSSQLTESTMPEISIVGKSNVGKSSLLNKLCNNKKLAKISANPGKTTTINFFSCDKCYIVDLPGYGFAKRSKAEKDRWSELIEGYFTQERNHALTIILLDIRHMPTKLDCQMIEYIHELGLPFVIVLTKADKLSKQKAKQAQIDIIKFLKLDDRVPIISTSATKATGISTLKEHIEQVTN